MLSEDDRDTPPTPLWVDFRPVPGFPRYRVGSDVVVWVDRRRPGFDPLVSVPRWTRLRSFKVSGSGRFVRLRLGGVEYVRSAELLRRAAFASEPDRWLERIGPKSRAVELQPASPAPPPVYRPVTWFPGYRLGSDSTIESCFVKVYRGWRVSDPPVWHPIRPDAKGIVRLYREGRSHPVSLGRLYLEIFPDAADLRRDALPAVEPAETPAPAPAPVTRFQPLPPIGHGGPAVGCQHGRAKLTEAQVMEARRLRRRAGWTYPELAERYGVTDGTMLAAVSGKTWGHLPMEPE